jgi:hypothetical protein
MYSGPGDLYQVMQTFTYSSSDNDQNPILIRGRTADSKWLAAVEKGDPTTCAAQKCWVKPEEVNIESAVISRLPIVEYEGPPPELEATILKNGVKLRDGPSVEYPVVMVAQKGMTIVLISRNAESTWLNFEFKNATGNTDYGWVDAAQTDFPAEKIPFLDLTKGYGEPPTPVLGWTGDPIGTVCINLHGTITGKFAQDNPDTSNSFISSEYETIVGVLHRILWDGLWVRVSYEPCDATLDVNLTINMLGDYYTDKSRPGSGSNYCYDGVYLQSTITLSNGKKTWVYSSNMTRPNAEEILGCPIASSFSAEGSLTTVKNLRRVWGDPVLIASLNNTYQADIYNYAMKEILALGTRGKPLTPRVLAYCAEWDAVTLDETCYTMLKSITGQDLGTGLAKWQDWWDQQNP